MAGVPIESSFRDPSGFIFHLSGAIYRQVNRIYLDDYSLLMQSGLYDQLVEKCLLVPHTEEDLSLALNEEAAKVIRPRKLPFISYPYEWCFNQLRDAGLATLEIQKYALDHGMSLKDASAYNIQFWNGHPTLIDTLSFEKYEEGQPWIAYGQFCRHFVAPLVLMSECDVRLNKLSRAYIDGIPLDLASKLAPKRTKWNLHIAAHLHLHAKSVIRPESGGTNKQVSLKGIRGILDSLESLLHGLKWKSPETLWKNYYSETNYSDQAMIEKLSLVEQWIADLSPKPQLVWDLGANNGRFSQLASEKGLDTVAWDIDPNAIEACYAGVKQRNDAHLLPLIQDLTNPSPALGWAHHERDSLESRGPADLVLALALIHHLAIGNNVPLSEVASFLSRIGKNAIVEFIPKEDSQVQRLLSQRKDIFDRYSQDHFEQAIQTHFEIVHKQSITETCRTLYLLKNRNKS